MSNNKKIKIKYSKNRVVLSDILPYELPIIFTNRYFYKFLNKHQISFNIKSNGKYEVTYKELNEEQKLIMKLLFNGIEASDTHTECGNNLITIPFNFKIKHKENDFRELSIIHPISQLSMTWFYNEYSELIKYYCNISKFSLRKPHKIAKYKLYKKNQKINNIFEKYETIEEDNGKNENLKTFFTYKSYSNIHKFFESYKYQRAEKKFNKLFKFDISKCFDSIYTHSLSWHIYNKNIVKEMISKNVLNNEFGSYFDEFMQRANYNETNGIVIGPEFSRIFAEILLQNIDNEILIKLKKSNYYHMKNYEVYRYVDDFFIFYNDEETKEKIFELYKLELKKYNLYINDSKCQIYEKPIITELTMAKEKINNLMKDNFTFEKILHEESNELVNLNFYANSQTTITKFKILIKETGVNYNDVLNWTYAILNNRLESILLEYKEMEDKSNLQTKVCKFVLELLDFSFFLYAVNPKISSTIKISYIVSLIIKFSKDNHLTYEFKQLIYKKIYDEIIFILNKHTLNEYTQIETSYLLLTMSELGKRYRVDTYNLFIYFKLNDKKINLSYLTIVIILFYIKNIKRYKKIKRYIKVHILRTLEQNKGSLNKNSETIFLLFDVLSCPYLERSFKKQILKKFGIKTLYDKIIDEEKIWFIKWNDLDFMIELKNKRSLEVYS